MPFAQIFEKRVNAGMQESDEPREDTRKSKEDGFRTPEGEVDAEDADMSEKKERPPRFSALFGVAPLPPAQQLESYPESPRKSGIWMPTSLFVLFAIILLFESTLLFAYTIIGFYHNLPAVLVPSAAAGCNCEAYRPAVNIAPNFLMPQAQAIITQTHTVTMAGGDILSDLLPAPTASSSVNLPTSSRATSTANASSQAVAANASNMLGLLNSVASVSASTASSSIPTTMAPTSTLVLTQSPQQSTVNSTTLITVDAAGSTLPPRPTVTSTQVIDASQAAAASSSAAAESSRQSVVASLAATLTRVSSTTIATSVASTVTPAPETTPFDYLSSTNHHD